MVTAQFKKIGTLPFFAKQIIPVCIFYMQLCIFYTRPGELFQYIGQEDRKGQQHGKNTVEMVFCYQNCSDLLWEKNCSKTFAKCRDH